MSEEGDHVFHSEIRNKAQLTARNPEETLKISVINALIGMEKEVGLLRGSVNVHYKFQCVLLFYHIVLDQFPQNKQRRTV